MLRDRLRALAIRKAASQPRFAFLVTLAKLATYEHQLKTVEVSFNSDAPLGDRGQSVFMPMDTIILPKVLSTGGWDSSEVDFIKQSVQGPHVLIDVGANIGLFARQVLRCGAEIDRVIAVEADPENFQCLQRNLADFSNVHAFNVGLGQEDGTLRLFRDSANHGNYSFIQESMEGAAHQWTDVPLRDASSFFDEAALDPNSRLIWKSDTQGYDEIILSRVPMHIWERVDCAVVELTRLPKPAFDQQAFKERIASFPTMRFSSGGAVSVDEVMTYLQGRDGLHDDLLLSR